MIDQANKLRDMVNAANAMQSEPNQNPPGLGKPLSARVITVTSGKGGVGKTNFTINLAIYFAKQNKRVVIIDADLGLANIDVLFGLVPKYSFSDVLSGEKTIAEVLSPGPLGIQFVSGGSGMGELANVSETQLKYLLENLGFLDEIADVVLIDTGAGISKSVVNFIMASKETIIITTAEPTAVTDAYAIIKTVKSDAPEIPRFKIVVNRVESAKEGQDVFEKLDTVSKRFLDVGLLSLGSIPNDTQLIKAVRRQQPVSTAFPNAPATKSIEQIGRLLMESEAASASAPKDEGIKSFVRRLINIFGSK